MRALLRIGRSRLIPIGLEIVSIRTDAHYLTVGTLKNFNMGLPVICIKTSPGTEVRLNKDYDVDPYLMKTLDGHLLTKVYPDSFQ